MSFTPVMSVESPVIGHLQTRTVLERELSPQPALLFGPESTGKWLMASWIADYHAPWYNQRKLVQPKIDEVRGLRAFLATVPTPSELGSGFKVVAINLDGVRAVGFGVQNALLKDLEESPEYVRWVLAASRSPLPTISSRCAIWRCGRLTDEEVAQVLVLKGVSQRDAVLIAPAGRGGVAQALAAAERFRPAKATVLAVARAMRERDSGMFERAVRVWGETEDWMLREMLWAAASGNPTPLFSSTERQLIGSTAARRGIALLSASGRARPQIAIRALAAALMTDER
jgi:DNA polymerase III delta prime subunit